MPTFAPATPANGGVLLEVLAIEPLTAGFSSVDDTPPAMGKVVAVGGGVPWLKPETVVAYSPFSARPVGISQALVDQRHILATFKVTCPNACTGALTGQQGCPDCTR
jgi:hypothetical protein